MQTNKEKKNKITTKQTNKHNLCSVDLEVWSKNINLYT